MSDYYLLQQLASVDMGSATEEQKAILEKAEKQVGFIPNMYSNMANLPVLLDTYLHGYDAFRQQSDLSPAEQEVVFLAISQQNDCHYCMAAHSTLAANYSGVPADTLEAIRQGETIDDPKFAALFAMAVDMNNSRGRPSPAIVKGFMDVGYTEKHLLAIVLALSVKTLSNYSNHLFATEVDEMFAAHKI